MENTSLLKKMTQNGLKRLNRELPEVETMSNCWNTTIVFHDESQPVLHTTAEEMDAWLNENTSEINEYQATVRDILVMRGQLWSDPDELIHTAVYLDEDSVFHKPGCFLPCEISFKQDVLNQYRIYTRRCYWVRVNQSQQMKAA